MVFLNRSIFRTTGSPTTTCRFFCAQIEIETDRDLYDPSPIRFRCRAVTLEDAGNYITRLSKAEHEATEWLAAMESLILVATSGGPIMFARIGVMRALNHHEKGDHDDSFAGTGRDFGGDCAEGSFVDERGQA